jgi:hypothetical protein
LVRPIYLEALCATFVVISILPQLISSGREATARRVV